MSYNETFLYPYNESRQFDKDLQNNFLKIAI